MEKEFRPQNESVTSHEHTSENCVFCDIIRGRSEASVITINDIKGVIAFMDLQGYPLVCPVKHISGSTSDIRKNASILTSMNELAFQIVPFMQEVFQNQGVNIITNIGEAAGQEVPHIHTHVIPRYTNDKVLRIKRVQNFSREELNTRAEKLSLAIDSLKLE